MPDSILGKLTEFLGQNWPWYKQPLPLALASLVEIRDELRAKNLYDSEEPPFATRTDSLPAGVTEARTADGKIAQRVHIIDVDGVPWEALYTLELQPDGSLKITGCMLLKAGQAA